MCQVEIIMLGIARELKVVYWDFSVEAEEVNTTSGAHRRAWSKYDDTEDSSIFQIF